jgi:hypothetical protein
MKEKVYAIYLTEITLPQFLIFIALRRKICILGAYSYFQNHGGYLQKLVTKLKAKGTIKTLTDYENLFPYKDSGDFQRLTNAFSESEPWMERQFNLSSLKGVYALACKHIICNRTHALYQRNYDLYYLANTIVAPSLNAYDNSFFQFRFGKLNKQIFFEVVSKYILNFSFLILSLLQCFIWIFSRIRFTNNPQKITFATDYNGGPRDMKFWDYLNPDKTKTLVVVRDKYTMQTFGHLLGDYKVVFDNEGYFGLWQGIRAWLKSFNDSIVLFVSYVNLPPDYYRQICFLPFKKIKYRALFNKYNCNFFWGRDDYNYQHILRSQEIRRRGGVSMGCNHGIQSIVTAAFQLRYLDFDYYYMHGLDQYTNVYSKYWPNQIIAKGVGSMFSNPEQQALIKETDGTDVAIIIAPSFHQDLIFDAISRLATTFPDLTFWVATKPKHRFEGSFGKKYQNLILSGFENVKESIDDVYDLLPRCKYVFSESSTLLAEAVYFDRIALCFDPDPSFKFLYYRKFPEMIFKDVDGLIARIQETRNLPVHYNDPNLGSMTFKGDRHPWCIIKEDMIIHEPNLNYEKQN